MTIDSRWLFALLLTACSADRPAPEARGAHTSGQSICREDLGPAVDAIAARIVEALGALPRSE